MKKLNKKVISILFFVLIFLSILIEKTNATDVNNAEELIEAAESPETSDIRLVSSIDITENLNFIIEGTDKTLDLNNNDISLNGESKIILNYNTNNKFILEDSSGRGFIYSITNEDETTKKVFEPINNTYNDIEMIVNGGGIETNSLWIFNDTNGFNLKINNGDFRSKSALFKFSSSYNSKVILNRFTLRITDADEEDENENLKIEYYGKYSQKSLSTIMSDDSKIIYINNEGEYLEQSKNILCGKEFKNNGKILVIPKKRLEIENITFDTKEYGYSRIPQQSVVINNTSDSTIKVVNVCLLRDGGEFSLGNTQGNGNISLNISPGQFDGSYMIRPVTNLRPGKYSDLISVITEEDDEYRVKVLFEVTKAHLDLSINLEDWEYELDPNEPSSNGNLGNGYEVYEYAKKIDGIPINNLNYSAEVPTEIGKYVVRLSVEETDNYLAGSATKEFKIKRKQIDPEIHINDDIFVFSGNRYKPDIIVEYTNQATQKILEKDIDYEIEYGENINAGLGTVTIKSLDTSFYKFEDKTKNFTISPKEILNENVNVPELVSYTGEALYPNVVITDENKELVKDTDYELEYEGQNGNVGDEILIRISGKGNYTGTIEKKSTITDKKNQVLNFAEPSITKVYNDSNFTIYPNLTIGDGSITFASSNTNVVEINDTTGEVKIVGIGKATITATASETQNYISEKASYDVIVNKANYNMSNVKFENLTISYDKNSHSIIASNLPEGVAAQYTNNNKIEPGKYEIEAKFIGDYEHYNSIPNRKATLTINKANYNLNNLKFSDLTVTYDNSIHNILATGLPEGVKVTYTNNGKINVGIYKVTANFMVDSTRYNSIPSRTAILTIKAKNIDNTIKFGIVDKNYTGKNLTQVFSIIDGNRILKEGIDYNTVYKNNKKVGTATLTISGKGNYTGIETKTFRILPKSTSLKKLHAESKQFTVTWKAQKTETTGYQIEYSTNKNFKRGNKKITIKKNKTTEKTIKKLKSKKKYYVRIRTYKTVQGKKYYSKWSKVKNIKTNK